MSPFSFVRFLASIFPLSNGSDNDVVDACIDIHIEHVVTQNVRLEDLSSDKLRDELSARGYDEDTVGKTVAEFERQQSK